MISCNRIRRLLCKALGFEWSWLNRRALMRVFRTWKWRCFICRSIRDLYLSRALRPPLCFNYYTSKTYQWWITAFDLLCRLWRSDLNMEIKWKERNLWTFRRWKLLYRCLGLPLRYHLATSTFSKRWSFVECLCRRDSESMEILRPYSIKNFLNKLGQPL